ncbi:GDSL-type esterase/lipase family protein [Nonomuraea sp. NPDC046802]|uniref:GDSL-type esterase/lipase family protein n=1 Tax=Nonomuraea sp. NPDC046802 TaxID=3154919 RepID=UPI0033C98C51
MPSTIRRTLSRRAATAAALMALPLALPTVPAGHASTASTATAHTATSAGTPTPFKPVRYVALGDSYTQLVPAAGATYDLDSLLCPRNWANYPHQVAQRLGLWDGQTNFPPADHAAFADASCGGAVSDNVIKTPQLPADLLPQYVQGNFKSLPAQMYAAPDLVTLSIGGNDTDTGIPLGLSSLLFQTCRNQPDDPVKTPCKDANNAKAQHLLGEIQGRVDQVIAKIHTGFDYPTLLGTLHVPALREGGHLLVIGYPTITPSKQDMTYADYHAKCYTGAGITMTYGDADWLATTVFPGLNNALKQAAQAHGDTYVDTYTTSNGHDYCQAPLTTTTASTASSGTSRTAAALDCEGKRWIDPDSLHPNACESTNQTELIMNKLNELGLT